MRRPFSSVAPHTSKEVWVPVEVAPQISFQLKKSDRDIAHDCPFRKTQGLPL